MPSHIALVSESANIPLSQVAIASAAIQKQVTRDLSPIWGVDATVDPFETIEAAPPDAWLIIIRDNIDHTGQPGYHVTNQNQPFALVLADANWSLTSSHEALEMIIDPFGSTIKTGPAPSQAPPPLDGLGFVPYLVEVCDPCEGPTFAYTVDNVTVSDFVTPDYYTAASTAGHFSFRGNVTSPHQVLEGGYVSFQNVMNYHWLQLAVSNQQAALRDFGFIKPSGRTPLREIADRTARRARKKSTSRSTPTAENVFTPFRPSDAQVARAKFLRESIAKLK